MKHTYISNTLVVIQFSCIFLFAFTGHLISENILLLLIEISGVVFGLWAIYCMRKSKLNISPEVRSGSILISSGPYKLIRNPMYLSILLTFVPLLIDRFSLIRLIILSILTANLLFKIEWEEKLLDSYFPNFKEYKKNTFKLIPFLY